MHGTYSTAALPPSDFEIAVPQLVPLAASVISQASRSPSSFVAGCPGSTGIRFHTIEGKNEVTLKFMLKN